MPRARKTRSGDRAQHIGSVPGQRYGEGVAQQQMQREMPAPVRNDVPSSPGTATGATPSAPVVAGPPPTDPAQLAAALSGAPLGLLSGGTQLPNQPVTAGLSTGPGPGPNALGSLRARSPLARTLRNLQARTGDPMWARLADRIGQ